MTPATSFALGVIEFLMGGICFLLAAKLMHTCKDSPELEAWKIAQINRMNKVDDTQDFDLEYWRKRQTQELIKSRLIEAEETHYMQ